MAAAVQRVKGIQNPAAPVAVVDRAQPGAPKFGQQANTEDARQLGSPVNPVRKDLGNRLGQRRFLAFEAQRLDCQPMRCAWMPMRTKTVRKAAHGNEWLSF